jgi:hypothetical protein
MAKKTIKGRKTKKKKDKKVASDIFELRKGDWRQIKDDSGNYNQEYLRRIRNGTPVKTA